MMVRRVGGRGKYAVAEDHGSKFKAGRRYFLWKDSSVLRPAIYYHLLEGGILWQGIV